VDIRQMVENDWKTEISFFYHMTGIDSDFFNNYLTKSMDFGLQNVTNISKRLSDEDK
jgi:hypothetical protein